MYTLFRRISSCEADRQVSAGAAALGSAPASPTAAHLVPNLHERV